MFAKSVTNLGGVSGIQVNFDLLKDTHPLNVTSTTGILLGSIKRGKEGGQRCEQQESEEFTCANKHPIEQNMDDALWRDGPKGVGYLEGKLLLNLDIFLVFSDHAWTFQDHESPSGWLSTQGSTQEGTSSQSEIPPVESTRNHGGSRASGQETNSINLSQIAPRESQADTEELVTSSQQSDGSASEVLGEEIPRVMFSFNVDEFLSQESKEDATKNTTSLSVTGGLPSPAASSPPANQPPPASANEKLASKTLPVSENQEVSVSMPASQPVQGKAFSCCNRGFTRKQDLKKHQNSKKCSKNSQNN